MGNCRAVSVLLRGNRRNKVVARKIAYNIALNTIFKVLSTALALVGIGFITRYLGKEGFGNYATVLAFFAFFSSLLDLGLYTISTREISRQGADEEKIIGNVFWLRFFSSVALFLISPLIVFLLPYPEEVKKGILLAAGAFVFSSSYLVLNGVFQKNLVIYKVTGAELIGKILQVSFVILTVLYDWGFTAIVLSLLLNMIFNFVAVYYLCRRYVKIRFLINFSYWKKFLRHSLPMGVAVFVSFLYFKTDTILLSLLRSSQDVGIYNAAYKIIENITFFPAMIMGLIFPLMSKNIFSEKTLFEKISHKTFKIFFLLVIPMVIGALFLADDLVFLIGGKDFSQSANVLRILIFSLAFIFFGHFFNYMLIAGNLQKKLMQILFFCAAFNITANLIFIPFFSYYASAMISLATEALVVFTTAFLAAKKLGYIPRIEKGINFLFSGAVMAGFLFLFRDFHFLFLIVGGAVVYFFLLGLTGTITKQEIISLLIKKQA